MDYKIWKGIYNLKQYENIIYGYIYIYKNEYMYIQYTYVYVYIYIRCIHHISTYICVYIYTYRQKPDMVWDGVKVLSPKSPGRGSPRGCSEGSLRPAAQADPTAFTTASRGGFSKVSIIVLPIFQGFYCGQMLKKTCFFQVSIIFNPFCKSISVPVTQGAVSSHWNHSVVAEAPGRGTRA